MVYIITSILSSACTRIPGSSTAAIMSIIKNAVTAAVSRLAALFSPVAICSKSFHYKSVFCNPTDGKPVPCMRKCTFPITQSVW